MFLEIFVEGEILEEDIFARFCNLNGKFNENIFILKNINLFNASFDSRVSPRKNPHCKHFQGLGTYALICLIIIKNR